MSKDSTFPERQPTIFDVAKMANVSVSTVSRVFNGKDRVSDHTRQKVQKAMDALNYMPSSIATSMITGRTKMILVMIPDFKNPFYSQIMAGIESRLRESEYYAMVLSHDNFSSEAYDQIQAKFDKIVDGIIAIPDWNLQFYKNWNKPCVIVDRYQRGVDLNAILADNYQGGRMLTQELVNAGHQKIAMISARTWAATISDRLEGYRSVLQENGIPIREEYVVLEHLMIPTGHKGMIKLMQLPDPPTAVVAANNLICIGCIRACQELGLRIGEDISLVGYDDHELARYGLPGITVIDQPAHEMGKQAAANLLAKLNDDTLPPTIQVMQVELVRRGSVKHLGKTGDTAD